ncbi:MAG TPA: ABC transporter ATP-binding protein [Candidatus Acidoferrales bacterium]|nr:ABC transporter ATP-binding protein [Candidatus Acidoferrales bacterium]
MNQKIPKNPILFGIFASKPHKKWAIAALTFGFFATLLGRFNVIVLSKLTDAAATPHINDVTLWQWAITFPVVYLITQCIWRLSGFTGMRWILKMRNTIYNELYSYLSLHNKDYFNSRFAGSLTNKISNAVEGSNNLLVNILWDFIPLGFTIFWYAIFAGLRDWRLGTIIAVWALIFISINLWYVKKLQPYSYKSAHALSTLKGRLVDSLSNISLVQEYAHLKSEKKYIRSYVNTQYETGLAHWMFSEWVLVANGFFIAIFIFIMIASSVFLFQHGVVSIGVIVMVIAIVGDLSNQFFFIGQEMSNATRYYGEIKEGLEEILPEHTIKDPENAVPLDISRNTILFHDISFNYENINVFRNFSLTIKDGQKIGLVGRSGAGKSTFVSLLLRHYDVDEGKITIDGQNINDVTLDSLRKAIAYVPQDTSLFHRTIRENISYGTPQATQEQIKLAAKQAQADKFVEKLPKKYETLVGERGVKLSGGQRQRIAIARAFLKDAPILILDEATSSLDSESEHAIQQSLDTLMEGRTVIAIAHRLSTLKKMNRIVVIENGKIIEDGDPNELLTHPKSIFKSMWNHQVRGFILDE